MNHSFNLPFKIKPDGLVRVDSLFPSYQLPMVIPLVSEYGQCQLAVTCQYPSVMMFQTGCCCYREHHLTTIREKNIAGRQLFLLPKCWCKEALTIMNIRQRTTSRIAQCTGYVTHSISMEYQN